MIVKRGALRFTQLPGRRSADPFAGSAVEGLSMRVVKVEPDVARSPHRHPHSYEVMFVLSGSGRLWEDGRSSRVETGDCVSIPPGVPHATVPDPGIELELVCFFPRGDLASNIEELTQPSDLREEMKGSS